MKESVQAIVLGMVRHSDRVNIVNMYTNVRGRISVITQTPSATKSGRMRAAALMPLSIIETEINFRNTSELQKMGAITVVSPNKGICGNPTKCTISLFLSEFLNRLLRESPADGSLWKFLLYSIYELNNISKPSNFHIAFLAQLSQYVGIMPDITSTEQRTYFDMREGRYTLFHPPHTDILTPPASEMPYLLSRLTYSISERLKLSRLQRREILDSILRYYAIHFPGCDRLNSLDVLKAL